MFGVPASAGFWRNCRQNENRCTASAGTPLAFKFWINADGRQFVALRELLEAMQSSTWLCEALFVDGPPLGGKPGRRILETDDDEELQPKLLRFGDSSLSC